MKHFSLTKFLQKSSTPKKSSPPLAAMSHELRTPLNGVIGMSNLLLSCQLGDTERTYAQNILHSAEKLLFIVNDLTDASGHYSEPIELEHIAFDIHGLSEELCEIMLPHTREKHMELLLSYPPETSRFAYGDPGRIRRILLHLLTNALKFTYQGSVELNVASHSIEYGPYKGKTRFTFEVTDTGIGITQQMQQALFDHPAPGRGLAVCHELARLMGGQIDVRSTLGSGSTFSFSLLLESCESTLHPINVPAKATLQGASILIIDDNAAARTITQGQLRSEECHVLACASADEAMNLLKTNRFDIAIIDYIMPEMDGIELCRHLKVNRTTTDISLLMVTSAPMGAHAQRLKEAGCSGYLCKPFAYGVLRDTLALILHARKNHQPLPFITQHNLKSFLRETPLREHFHQVHVLLAEDNRINQRVAQKMFENYGCDVTTVDNGEEAVREIRTGAHYDLVLMDCQMPVMSGYEATALIRKWQFKNRAPRVPIVAFTANSLEGDEDKCLDAGMDDYVTKPVREDDVQRILLNWLPSAKRQQINSKATLDESVFNRFSETVGPEVVSLIASHHEASKNYLHIIKTSIDKGDFPELSKGAHTIKSLNANLGALKTVHLARQLELLAQSDSPDIYILKELAQQLELESARAQTAMSQTLHARA